MISKRNRKLINTGSSCESIILVEFSSFLSEPWGRLSPYGDVEILDSGTVQTYYDYFVEKTFPKIAYSFDPFGGGLSTIPNLTFTLSNAENLIKDLRENTLENTQVIVYVLLSARGTFDKSDSEIVFKGYVEKYEWTDNKIVIRINDLSQRDNQNVLHTEITTEEFSDADPSIIGQFLPVVGGDWSQNYGGDQFPNLVRAVEINCTTPTYLLGKSLHRFRVADHPVKSTDIVPTNTYDENTPEEQNDEVRRNLGYVFQYQDRYDTLCPMYNGNTVYDADNNLIFTIPKNTRSIQGFFRPQDEIDNSDEITNADFSHDDDFIRDTGIYCRSTNIYDSDTWVTQWFKFPEALSFQIDELVAGAYIEVVTDGLSGEGRLVFKTDGNGHFATLADGTSMIDWEYEAGTSTTYYLRIHGRTLMQSEFVDDYWGYVNPDSVTFVPTETDQVFRSLNLIRRNDNWGFLRNSCFNATSNIHQARRHFCPPVNIQDFVSTDEDNRMGKGWKNIIFDETRFQDWDFGVTGKNGLRIRNVYLRFKDYYYRGGFVKAPPPIALKESRDPRRGGPLYIPDLGDLADTPEKRRYYGEEYEKWVQHKVEVEERSNVNPLFCMLQGYTENGLPGGTLCEAPVQHLQYWLQRRMNKTLGVDTDTTSFNAVAGRRQNVDGSNFKYQWAQHVAVTKQKSAFDVLRNLCKEAGLIMYAYLGKYFIMDTDFWTGFVGRYGTTAQFDENDLLSYKFSRQNKLFDAITINYGFDYASSRYRRKLRITPFDSGSYYNESDDKFVNAYEEDYKIFDVTGFNDTNIKNALRLIWDYYGETDQDRLHELIFNADTIQDVGTARRLLINLSLLFTKQRSQIEFKLGMKGFQLKIGDLCYISHTDFNDVDKGTYLIHSIVSDLAKMEFVCKGILISGG